MSAAAPLIRPRRFNSSFGGAFVAAPVTPTVLVDESPFLLGTLFACNFRVASSTVSPSFDFLMIFNPSF
jgi:hypothetical protein